MSEWLVTQGDNQFKVESLDELKQLAEAGKLKAGDMVQPPGAVDWMYATEIPDLKAIFDGQGDAGADEFDDYLQKRAKMGAMATLVAAVVMAIVLVVGGGTMAMLWQQLPKGDEEIIGEGGLTFADMIVTESGMALLAEPEERSSPLEALKKDQILVLLGKRGDFYRARAETGAEGWIAYDAVIPMYQLGGEDVREEYDPLYNPDRYVEVNNASWQQLPGQDQEGITVFQFMLRNLSGYPMTDLVIQATIKDAKGLELEKVEIPVEGMIPAKGSTMVGTLANEDEKPRKRNADEDVEPPTLLTEYSFKRRAEQDPELQLLYSAGVEVKMSSEAFTTANIDLIELRAVPNADASKVVQKQ
jgi:hypothetical protein